ncbi:L-2,4-diaminobutyric acid acetyltransferase [Rhodobacteraceae bacterium MBR-64]|jgi:L-2,4-diaminobutyric acid acetyltransferase
MTATATTLHKPKVTLRRPRREDGAAIWGLIRACKPLDENSMYCNLIQCDHFAETCIVAEMDGRIVGWISGYIVPDDPQTLFVWQVAVAEAARGQGLGRRMLNGILERDVCDPVRRLQTTITHDNAASWALFASFAKRAQGSLDSAPHFERRAHFDGHHGTEHMVTIDLGRGLRRVA